MNAMSPAMLDMIRKNKAKYAGGITRIKKVAEGKTRLRILNVPVKAPLHTGDEADRFWMEYGVHWIKSHEGKVLSVVGNKLSVYGDVAPLETMVEQAILNATTDDDMNLFKEMKSKRGILVNALNRTPGSPDASELPAVYELPAGVWADIMGLMLEYNEEHGNIFDPKTGTDINIERTGKGKTGTRYSVLPCFDSKNKPVSQDALDKAVDLFAFVEREFFRPGEDVKALTVLQNLTGLPVPALAPRTAHAALAAPAVSNRAAADAAAERVATQAAERRKVEEEIASIVETSAHLVETPQVEASVEDEEAELMRQMAALKAKKALAAAAKPVVQTAAKAPAKQAAPAEDFDSDLSMEDLNEQLSEI